MKKSNIILLSLLGVFAVTVLCFFLHYRNMADTTSETDTSITQERKQGSTNEEDTTKKHQDSDLGGNSGNGSSDSGITFAPTKEDPVQKLDDRIKTSETQPTKEELIVGYGAGETSLKDVVDNTVNLLDYKTVVFKNCRVINIWTDIFYGRALANLRVNNSLNAGDIIMSDRKYNTVEFAFADGSDVTGKLRMNSYVDIKCNTDKYAYVDTKEGDNILVLFGEVTSQK